MREEKSKRFPSYVLIALGLVLLFLGARDYLGSRLGQARHAEAWRWEPVQDAPPLAGATLGRLSVPRLGMKVYVLEGSEDDILRLGPGHLEGTAMPGENGNCIIAGHRDTHFRPLKDIKKGDEILLETRRGRFRYAVTGIEIVRPASKAALQETSEAVLHLITCYPFHYLGSAPKRFVVKAHKVEG